MTLYYNTQADIHAEFRGNDQQWSRRYRHLLSSGRGARSWQLQEEIEITLHDAVRGLRSTECAC